MKKLILTPFILVGLLLPFLLLFSVVLTSEEEDASAFQLGEGQNLSAEVLGYVPLVEKYCREYNISDQVSTILAIMMVESGGKGNDVMQSSESLGLPVNSLSPEASIKQGCKYFSELIKDIEIKKCDHPTAIQAYNFGGGFVSFVSKRGRSYSYSLAESFSKEKAGGQKVTYQNAISIPINGGWRYNYGNQFYVMLVSQYLTTASFDDQTVQAIMNEALKYKGYPYVFGGSTPSASFDCSGLTQWCYGKAGIVLPRTAQAQYDASQKLTFIQAKPGDLIFFHSTYATADYVTHVGIYVGNNQMFHAGDRVRRS